MAIRCYDAFLPSPLNLVSRVVCIEQDLLAGCFPTELSITRHEIVACRCSPVAVTVKGAYW